MTQRERPASGAVSAAAPPAPSGRGTSRPPSAVDTTPERLSSWQELFPNLPPDQQNRLLALARSQGVIYAAQLPAAPSGNGSDRVRAFLARLSGDLAPVCPTPTEFFDTELDSDQREAVSKALATPDLCLIAGLPGTG